jgi:hypothetical protein
VETIEDEDKPLVVSEILPPTKAIPITKPRQRDSHPEEAPEDANHMREAPKPQLLLMPPASFKPTSSDALDHEPPPPTPPSTIRKATVETIEDEDKPLVVSEILPPTKAIPITKPRQRDSHPEEAPEDGPNTEAIAPKPRCLSLTQSYSLMNAMKAGITLGAENGYPIADICNTNNCLKDEPIDCYSRLVEASENRRRGARVVVQMGSFWFTKHIGGNYTKDKDWPTKWYQKRAKGDENTIQQFHFVLNVGGDHWALAVLHPKLKELRVYDTLPREKNKVEKVSLGSVKATLTFELINNLATTGHAVSG